MDDTTDAVLLGEEVENLPTDVDAAGAAAAVEKMEVSGDKVEKEEGDSDDSDDPSEPQKAGLESLPEEQRLAIKKAHDQRKRQAKRERQKELKELLERLEHVRGIPNVKKMRMETSGTRVPFSCVVHPIEMEDMNHPKVVEALACSKVFGVRYFRLEKGKLEGKDLVGYLQIGFKKEEELTQMMSELKEAKSDWKVEKIGGPHGNMIEFLAKWNQSLREAEGPEVARDKIDSTVYIHELPKNITVDDLKEMFSTAFDIRIEEGLYGTKRHAWVMYPNHWSSRRALLHFNEEQKTSEKKLNCLVFRYEEFAKFSKDPDYQPLVSKGTTGQKGQRTSGPGQFKSRKPDMLNTLKERQEKRRLGGPGPGFGMTRSPRPLIPPRGRAAPTPLLGPRSTVRPLWQSRPSALGQTFGGRGMARASLGHVPGGNIGRGGMPRASLGHVPGGNTGRGGQWSSGASSNVARADVRSVLENPNAVKLLMGLKNALESEPDSYGQSYEEDFGSYNEDYSSYDYEEGSTGYRNDFTGLAGRSGFRGAWGGRGVTSTRGRGGYPARQSFSQEGNGWF